VSLPADHPISFWYGPAQRFGHLGQAQRWINVLGHIAASEEIESIQFTINSNDPRPLNLGSDLHRLAHPGDFNIEVAWDEVEEGENTLVVTAQTKNGEVWTNTVQLSVEKGRQWPLPYMVDFSTVKNLQDATQVVDGHWRLEANGARTIIPYYDRVLSMGDTSWTDYETTVSLTVHSFTPSAPGPPTYNVTHMGIAMRWRGHHSDGLQPRRRWYPLGAQGEFLFNKDLNACQWRILFDRPTDKEPRYAEGHNVLILGQPAFFKTQIRTMEDGRSRYRFKQWQQSQPEPATWDVEGFETDDYTSGSLCLVPHNSDVTIHRVEITLCKSPPL
jgi:hypothetical protein